MKKLKFKKLKNNGNDSCKSIVFIKNKMEKYFNLVLDVNDVCKLTGISKTKFEEYRLIPDFEEFLQKMALNGEIRSLESIHKASDKGYWQAGAWFLERKYPEKYGKKDLYKAEYEAKLEVYKKVLLGLLEELEPSLKFRFLAKLNKCDIETSLMNSSAYVIEDAPKQLTDSSNVIDL